MSAPAPYRAIAHAGGGREGRAHLDNEGIWFAMALPKEMGGAGLGSNPEQLFALGWATCFNSAVLFVAKSKNIDAAKAKVTCEVSIARGDDGFGLAAKLTLAVPGLDAAQVKELVEAAHQVCPYSKATRGNIPVELAVA
ncbi:MAG: organic hydroperoxide resistance protein [Hyphomonadaceae bacterium]|nr:organic hydroperoxide resistance protein [Hyphomonadaceae bacterium]